MKLGEREREREREREISQQQAGRGMGPVRRLARPRGFLPQTAPSPRLETGDGTGFFRRISRIFIRRIRGENPVSSHETGELTGFARRDEPCGVDSGPGCRGAGTEDARYALTRATTLDPAVKAGLAQRGNAAAVFGEGQLASRRSQNSQKRKSPSAREALQGPAKPVAHDPDS